MKTLKPNYRYPILLLIFSIPLFFLNIRDKHPLGDDFAQYLIQAENIAHGRPFYQSNYIYNNLNAEYAPPQYPPGYSLLLVPTVKMFGLEMKPLFYTNTLIFVALLFVLFFYFRKYASNAIAICLSLIIVYSEFVLDMKGNLNSDAPCLLFTVLYLYLRNTDRYTPLRVLLLILTATMTILTRSQGLLLIAAEGLVFAYKMISDIRSERFSFRNIWRSVSVIVAVGTVALYVLLNMTVFRSPVDAFSFYSTAGTQHFSGWQEVLGRNSNYLITLFLDFFHYSVDAPMWQSVVTIICYAGLILSIIGFFISARAKFKVDDAFFIVMILFMLLFPIHGGTRYVIELIPVFVLYIYFAFKTIVPYMLPYNKRVIAVACTLLYLALGIDTFHKMARNECNGCVPDKREEVIFSYINTHVSDSDIIVILKPRMLTLFTNKKAMNISWTASTAENKRRFDSLGVKYLLKGFDDDHYLRNYLNETRQAIDSTVIIDDFVMYKLR